MARIRLGFLAIAFLVAKFTNVELSSIQSASCEAFRNSRFLLLSVSVALVLCSFKTTSLLSRYRYRSQMMLIFQCAYETRVIRLETGAFDCACIRFRLHSLPIMFYPLNWSIPSPHSRLGDSATDFYDWGRSLSLSRIQFPLDLPPRSSAHLCTPSSSWTKWLLSSVCLFLQTDWPLFGGDYQASWSCSCLSCLQLHLQARSHQHLKCDRFRCQGVADSHYVWCAPWPYLNLRIPPIRWRWRKLLPGFHLSIAMQTDCFHPRSPPPLQLCVCRLDTCPCAQTIVTHILGGICEGMAE